ncbi:MAG: DNA-processing protein DprA, partial [Clostridiales bacterium]|nr:DNA-processing protein DprA [Clostridiales bacterium]
MSEALYLIWLSMIDGIGKHRMNALLSVFDSAENIYSAGRNELRHISELKERDVEKILSARDLNKAEETLDKIKSLGISYVTLKDREYPPLLKEMSNPPVIIYVMGTLPNNSLTKISIIGSRRCSSYGADVTRTLTKNLIDHNIVIVSGMARGIDSIAHKTALEYGGLTVAVLGCGLDICYPPENAELRGQIINKGCIISEYLPGMWPAKHLFPERNRIISGLSKIVIVTEASLKSGTLITASHALEQNREVMAVPGNITSALSEGTNYLISQGATVVTSYKDVLNTLNMPALESHAEKPKISSEGIQIEIDLYPTEKLDEDHPDDHPDDHP